MATIVVADIVGYSRLMDADEEGAYAALRALREQVIEPGITAAGGRIVKHLGDGFLAEFPAVMAGVRFAISMQDEIRGRNEGVAAHLQIQFRIGINLGDVIVDQEGDIFGDGVNIAARLEALARPGGICVSGPVYRSVHKRLPVDFDDLGEQEVKNIPTPVHAYRLRRSGEPDDPSGRAVRGSSFFSELRQRKVFQTAALYMAVAWGATEILVTVIDRLFLPAWISTLVVIAFVVGFPVAMFLAWTFDVTPDGIRRTTVESRRGKASIVLSLVLLVAGTTGLFVLIQPALRLQEEGAATIDAVPNSLAVLPFVNAGQNPDDVWLSEGLSDELRDQLGRVSGIRVAARSSSVAARAQDLDALAISERLRVANLVEGSVRREGDTLRISVQLIEGKSGLVLWSRAFERGTRELVNVQHSIAMMLVQQVLPDAGPVTAEPATLDYSANELMLLARHKLQQVRDRQQVDIETLQESVQLYRQATEADPQSALAHSRLADALLYLGDIEAAEAPIFKALTLNPNLSEVQNTLGSFYWAKGLPEVGAALERAVELNPNNADALANNAYWRWFQKYSTIRVEEYFRRALELDPLSLARYAALGEFYGLAGQQDDMFALIDRIRQNFDSPDSYRLTGWLLELAGRLDESVAWVMRARDREPDNPDHQAKLAELYALMGDFDTALRLDSEPGVGLLFLMQRYAELIDIAELAMIDRPGDVQLRYLLAFAYNALGQYESAIHVLSTTGQPDTVLKHRVRSAADIEGFYALVNALAGAGLIDMARELAQFHQRELARFHETEPWVTVSDWWNKTFEACGLAILQRDAEALQGLDSVRESPRLPWLPVLRDSFCFERYAGEPLYRELLHHVEQRQKAVRERLPATYEKFGVSLDQSPLK